MEVFLHGKYQYMKYIFNISGIACGGCIQNVTDALNSVPGIRVEKVQKEAPQAIFSADAPISEAVVQSALSARGKYTIVHSEKTEA